MSSFALQLSKNKIIELNPELARTMALINKQGFTITEFEPFQYTGITNVATDPSFDIVPFLANNTYHIVTGGICKHSTTQAGFMMLEFYDPFANVLRFSYSNSLNNTAPINQGFPASNFLASRVRWNDNGATVGIYSVLVQGFKISYIPN